MDQVDRAVRAISLSSDSGRLFVKCSPQETCRMPWVAPLPSPLLPLANSEHGLDGIAAYGIGDHLTNPVPKMAMLAPSDTCSEFITVPAPVCNPQPNGAKSPRGKSLGTLTRLRSVARA